MAKNNFNITDRGFTHVDKFRQSARFVPTKGGLYDTMKAGIEKRMPSRFICEATQKSGEIDRPANESKRRSPSDHKHPSLIAVGMAIVGAVAIAINPKWLPGTGALISKSK